MTNKFYKSRYLYFILSFFFVTSTKALDLLYPRNNVFTAENPIPFSWERSLTATPSYKLIISANPDMSAPLINIITSSPSTSVPMSSAVSGTTYYWKVFDRVLGISSSINSFTFIIADSIGPIAHWYRQESGFVTSSGKVIQWNDAVASGNNMVQSTVSLQPAFIAQDPLINNRSAVVFSGSPSNYLQSTATADLTNFSVYCLRTYATYSGVPLQYFLSSNGQGLFSEASALGAGFGSYNGSLVYTDASSASLKTQYCIYLHSNTKLKINNTVPAIISPGALTSFSYNTLGTRADATDFAFKGKIAELLVFKSELDNNKDQLVYNYLADKYAPPVNLGQDTILGTSFCDSVIISASNRFVSYLWNTGKTSFTLRIPSGTYSVTVKDVFGRFSSDDLSVYPYRRLGNKTIYLCSGQTYTLDLKTPIGFRARWNTGDTTTTLNISTTGQYTVTITDNRGCTVKDTINAIVDNPRLSMTPISNNINACSGEKLFIQTETAFDSIRWSTGSTNNFISLIDSGNYSLYAQTSIGCVINKSFHVTIVGKAPTVKFGYSAPCQGTAINFTDSTIIPAGNTVQSWKWNFSNGTTSNTQNPSVTYTGLGLASASLKVTTNVGCSDSVYKTFVVNKIPQDSFYNLQSCAGIPTTFIDASIPNSAAITDWNWNFGGLGVSNGIQNPSFRFPSAGTYNVTLKVTNSNGCTDTITLPTTVNVSPVSNFSNDSVCGRTPVTFKFLASVAAPASINSYQWNFGDNSVEDRIYNPQHIYATPGTYDVSLVVRSSENCIDTIVKQVKVFDFPIVDFNVSATQCVGKEIQFTDITVTPDGTPIVKWNWFFSGQGTSQIPNPRFTFNSEGNYTIQLTAKNAVGCSGTKLRSIAISAPPTPKFTFSPQNGLPPLNVNYTNQSSVTGNYIWDYGDGSPLVQAYNPPLHTYTVKGTYPIKLIATDFRGCTDTLTKYILVDKAYLDGVLASISITPDGDFYKVQATIINNSNIEITALGLGLQLGGGAVIRENWTGSLLPGQTTVYLFIGEIKLSDNNQIPIICASIDNINNNSHEDRTDNNSTCKEVKVGDFNVFNIYPNPAFDNINFGVMLPKDGSVNIRFVDALGQQMYNKDFDGVKGYNNFAMPTAMLNAAVYIAVISYDGEIIRKKFMRNDRKN